MATLNHKLGIKVVVVLKVKLLETELLPGVIVDQGERTFTAEWRRVPLAKKVALFALNLHLKNPVKLAKCPSEAAKAHFRTEPE